MAEANKRRRHVSDIDGSEDEVEIESASSSFRQNVNKRTKVALARESRSGTLVSDSEDEDTLDHYDDLLEEGNGSDMDEEAEHNLQQLSEEENEEEDVDELKATQIVRKQMNRYKDNIPMDEGIIEEVFCRNFMCHSKLRITLGPLINFIVGHNGSGKSAVLTALTLCLGGKAAATNRGANLKSLIKVGQDSASLSVKIKNRGENAYKPEEYGRSIIVERHFNRAGASGFRVKNEHGKEISKKKADLDDILDYFALQLDNPINVLTQDMARQFLSNSTPADKYKFFIKGTNLQTLDSDYKIFEEQLDIMNEKLRIREDDINQLLELRNQAELRKKRSERTAQIFQKIRGLQRQLAWAQVEEQEQTLDRYKEDTENQIEAVRLAEEKAEEVNNRFEAADTGNEAAQRAVSQYQEQLQPALDAHAEEKLKFDENTKLLLDNKTEQRNIRENMKAHKKEAIRLTNEVRLEQERLSDDGGIEHTRLVEQLVDLKQQVEDAKRHEEEHIQNLPTLQEANRVAEAEMREAAADKDRTAKRGASAQASLRDHDRAQGGKYDPYRPNMGKLCQEIDRETRWKSKPIGPVGLHIQLLKPEWSSILEKTFGGNLDSFIVSCRDDQQILSKIAKRVGCQTSIFIGSSEPIDTTANEPEGDVETVLSVLRINEPAVRNLLIIATAAEQTVLISDGQQASEYMMTKPKNVKATLAFGASRDTGIRYDMSRSGQDRSGPIQAWNGPVRMKTDRAEQRQILQQRLNDALKEADVATQRHRSLVSGLEKTKQALIRHKRDGAELRASRQRAEDEVDVKQAEIEKRQPQDGKLQELQSQLEEAKAEQQTAEESLQDSYDKKEKLDDIAKELKEKLDTAQASLDLAKGRITQAEARLKIAEDKRHGILLEKNEMHDNVEAAKSHLVRMEERQRTQEENVNTFISEASKISARVAVEPGMSYDALDERLSVLMKQYEQEQQRVGGSQEELTRAFKEAEMTFLGAKNEKRELDDVAKSLKETLKERYRRWRLFRKYISARAKINFMYLLSERRFRGRVKLNHDAQELDIKVEPDIARQSDAGRQAKTLSGGEKSFSTICLLLSIWEAMGSPIRCLDEFDVFMDSVNRKQSMDLMIQTARRSVGRQFILITPQSMQNVDMADDVKVHKMSDPERGQLTLAFHGQEV